jgi:hypothetical protein
VAVRRNVQQAKGLMFIFESVKKKALQLTGIAQIKLM